MLMSNLFSIFDPSVSIFSLNWLVMFLFMFILPSFFFMKMNVGYMMNVMTSFFTSEITYVMNNVNKKKGVVVMFLSVFILIFILNFTALLPYLFSSTSHLTITMPLAYSIWVGIIIFTLYNFFSSYLSHLIPLGTPLMLMSFMVMVEFLSNLIRPLALTFRLTANMMAGHLLMSLITGFMYMFNVFLFSLGYLVQSLLTLMEMGVSFIQAYVFFTLLLLYLSESGV